MTKTKKKTVMDQDLANGVLDPFRVARGGKADLSRVSKGELYRRALIYSLLRNEGLPGLAAKDEAIFSRSVRLILPFRSGAFLVEDHRIGMRNEKTLGFVVDEMLFRRNNHAHSSEKNLRAAFYWGSLLLTAKQKWLPNGDYQRWLSLREELGETLHLTQASRIVAQKLCKTHVEKILPWHLAPSFVVPFRPPAAFASPYNVMPSEDLHPDPYR